MSTIVFYSLEVLVYGYGWVSLFLVRFRWHYNAENSEVYIFGSHRFIIVQSFEHDCNVDQKSIQPPTFLQ